MKRLVLIISAIISLATLQAQYLQTGDIVSISFKDFPWGETNDYYTYMEASSSGILSTNVVNDNCLWRLEVNEQNNTYTFQDLTTGKYLRIDYTGSNQEALVLIASPDPRSAFSMTIKEGEEGKYMKGVLYYNTVTHWGAQVQLMVSEYGGTFLVAGWNAYDLYIEKWEQKGAGSPTGHFNPSKIEFTYAKDDATANAQATNVEFMIEATTESYYQCVTRDEALLRRSTGNVDGKDIKINNIYWQSTGDKESDLDVSKYVAHQDANRTLMTLSDPVTQSEGRWQFTITPTGASPMGLKDNIGNLTRWIDYADNVIVEYTYGNGEVQKAEMRVVRKSYRRMDLPTLVFSINPATYTFGTAAEEKVFDVTPTHQHGHVILNVDSQAVVTHYDQKPDQIKLTDYNLKLELSDTWSDDLTVARDGDYKIKVTTKKHSGNKRSAVLTGTLYPQEQGSTHVPVSFTIDLHQRGVDAGIQLLPNSTAEYAVAPFHNRSEQQVHTAERTIYYLSGEPVELRLPESGFSGYMRWYDYKTNGGPNYNYCYDKTSTQWITAPYTNNRAFAAINTPVSKESAETKEGYSYGLYALNRNSSTTTGATISAAMGAILDETNPNNPAPRLQGWSDNAYHVMACDVSAYTDYKVEMDGNGQIKSITEPTLSYRQLFHMRPASEMADKLATLSAEGKYLENYKYQAPAGKQILLSTEYRHSKVRSHESELCYFYKDNGGNVHRIDNRQGNMLKWYVSEKDGSNRQEYTPRYIAAMDYLIVRSDNYTYDAPKVYTLELPANTVGNATPLLIAKFEVEFVDIERQGPTNKTIITQQRIETQYKPLAKINFDDKTTHLDWDEASYGYVYTTGNLAQDAYFKRGATQGAFPYYGEYMLTTGVDKDWAREPAHGGKGQSLYVDGTMEPGLVATISASGQICSGQTMYCSAWFCNPAPSGWSGEGNPIFRCNIQGKNDNETEWHDVGVYFVGELLKGSKWQQVVFPIQSKESYDRIRVSIYNFATTNQGNDFMVDDINLFVSQLPIAAYQGEMACRTVEGGETSAAAVLRIDYSNINAGDNGYMYYQIYNESWENKNAQDEVISRGKAVNLTGNAAYYHESHPSAGTPDHDHENAEMTDFGSVHIPAVNFDPKHYNDSLFALNENRTDTLRLYTSVSAFLDDLVLKNEKHGKAYIKTNNDGATKWLLYVAHIVNNTTVEADALAKLYEPHNYVMRMAYTPEELPTAECNLTTPLHATQKTEFQLRNSAKEVILHDAEGRANNSGDKLYFSAQSSQNCANDLYFLTSTVINHMALETGGTPVEIPAPIYSDWLIGDPAGDVLSEQAPVRGNYDTDEEYTAALADYNDRLQASIAGFKEMYGGYTHDQVATAIMYDMRRVPTSKDNNPNYTARTFQELNRSAFLSQQNYEIVRHLYENGWLQLCDTTVHFYLGSRLNNNGETIGDTVRYWCFPIEGTAKTMIKDENGQDVEITLKDCNEPHRVMVSATGSGYYYNITPIEYAKKTPQQSVQLPALKVLKGSKTITFPVTELGEGVTTAGQSVDDEGKNVITIDLETATYINLETGESFTETPAELVAGNEYTIRLTLLHEGYEYPGNDENNACRVGYAFLKLQILPSTLVWSPSGDSFNGWGKNENWKVWSDKDGDNQIDRTTDPNTNELSDAYVPIEGTNVIIPKMTNSLLYPYIVSEHEHNHYPMTINYQPHHCNNIYFAPEAKIYNQHLLDYKEAFVDMQLPAAKWHLVSAPLQGMVSGDMFVPHDGWYDEKQDKRVAEPNPFEVKAFNGIDEKGNNYEGIRSGDAAYAFWQAFYNTTTEGNTLLRNLADLQFTQSNTLVQPLTEGTGYAVYGLGFDEKDSLIVRLPKPDTHYDYYTNGKPNGTTVPIPEGNRSKLAYTDDHDQQGITITLTNKTASEYFLFGNPTMAFVDMHALHLNNNLQWTGEFKTMTSDVIIATTPSTMTTANRYLPPMTSALLKASSEATEMTITLLPAHLTLNNTINPVDEVEEGENESQQAPVRRITDIDERPVNYEALQSQLMTIYAFTPKGTARTVLATNPAANDYYISGEDALFTSTGVENESYVTTPLNMYTVAEQVPMMADVRQGISQIPLGILAADKARSEYMQVAFYLTANWSRECYFCDSQTGQKIRIMDGLVITIEMPLNHEQRYYIEGPDTYQGSDGIETSTTQPSVSTTGNKVWAYAPDRSTVVVSSSGLIKSATLYDITGRLITSSPNTLITNSITLSTTGTAGVYIVDVTLRDGSTEQAQVIVQ